MVVSAALSHLPEISARFPHVSIIGVGDGGNEVVSRIFENGGSGAQCIAINTSKDPLEHIRCHEKVLISLQVTGNTETYVGAVHEDNIVQACASSIGPLLTGADVAFIVAPMGDAENALVASSVAGLAKQADALTVVLATIPPSCERDRRLLACHELAKMRQSCHTLAIVDADRSVVFPADPPNLYDDSPERLVIDIVAGLSETLTCPSTVNIDLLAFRELMIHGGIAHIGIAHSSSALRVEEAAIGALRGPLLYDSINQSRGALVNVRGDSSLTLEDAERAAELVAERAGWDLPIVVGASADESWYDGCQVSIWLTGGTYPYIPGGHRRLPLDMYEMEPDGEEGPIDLDLDLDQLEDG